MGRTEESEALEALAMVRSGLAELSHDVARDHRKGMELLEEQIYGMGADCPQRLLDAYDNLAKAGRETTIVFESLEEGLTNWD